MIPAYDEERTVREVAESVTQLNPWAEVLVIDDGSRDLTRREAERAGVNVVSLPFHAGGTVAVLTGYLSALSCGYDFLVKIDADGQHRPEDVNRVLQPVLTGETDICVGSRYLTNGVKDGHDSTTKEVGRVFSSQFVSSLVGDMSITDSTSGLRAWNRKALLALTDAYMNKRRFPEDSILWPLETLIASRMRLRIREVPIETRARKYGKSKSFSFSKMVKYPVKLMALTMAR